MVLPVSQLLAEKRVGQLAGSATRDCLDRVERTLGVRLPEEYAAFLLSCNGCSPTSGMFAIGLEGSRDGLPFDDELDVLVQDFFCCDSSNEHDLVPSQKYYGLEMWSPPRHIISIAWEPAVRLILLDTSSGGVYGWYIPGDYPEAYGDIDWSYWTTPLGNSFSEFWERVRIVPSPY